MHLACSCCLARVKVVGHKENASWGDSKPQRVFLHDPDRKQMLDNSVDGAKVKETVDGWSGVIHCLSLRSWKPEWMSTRLAALQAVPSAFVYRTWTSH